MSFTLSALLAVFTLLAITGGVYFLSQKLRLPYTVLLVASGLALYPLTTLPLFSFLLDFSFTPELLFYVFLPVLIFESAYNINIRRFMENAWAVSVLSIVSLVLSAGVIAISLYYLLPLVGISVPFVLCLLFGSLISATDPVAVLALFKEYGAPRRLTLLFEGESIFNDGTAVALFIVVLGIVTHGFEGAQSISDGLHLFTFMVVGGMLFGGIIGTIFSWVLGAARHNEFVQITFMLVMAHLTFILTDFISTHMTIAGQGVHLSAIIATAIASIVLGNYGRAKVTPRAEEFVEKFWTQSAFLSNSLVFILIGLIFTTIPIDMSVLLLPIALSVIVVAVARALSIYPVVGLLNRYTHEEHIPRSWQHLLAWGSLRGALAVTMVLLIPSDLTLAGWDYAYTPKEFILALTIGCIFATLFIKATTIQLFMRKLGLSALTDIEHLELEESRTLVHERVLEKIDTLCKRGHVSVEVMSRLGREHRERMDRSTEACCAQLANDSSGRATIGERVLRMYAIGLERDALRRIYVHGEVNERVYRKALTKLEYQYDRFDMPEGAVRSSRHAAGPIRSLAIRVRNSLFAEYGPLTVRDRYMYYRALTVLSRAVIDIFGRMEQKPTGAIFGSDAFEHVRTTYTAFLERSAEKMRETYAKDSLGCEIESERIARHSILGVEERTLEEFAERRMITPKVHALLREELSLIAEELTLLDERRANSETTT
ncbi:MAG: sodium:proton antiporter [Candidatus Pacebacteria bacterium]|nr:sodium:proton antiporter [Candidatus Paceibacterota bacterium]